MTIDEAIKTLRECEISYIQGNKFPNISKEEKEHNAKCAEEYCEFADWLEELKWYRKHFLTEEELVEEIESITWYHINKNGELVSGANGTDDEPLYKANEILEILDKYRYDDGE